MRGGGEGSHLSFVTLLFVCFYPGQIVGLHLRILEFYTRLLFFALLRPFLFVCVFRVFAIIPNSVTCSRKQEALNNEKQNRV